MEMKDFTYKKLNLVIELSKPSRLSITFELDCKKNILNQRAWVPFL